MAKDKFMFFPNFKAMAKKLDDAMRLKFYDALTDYVFYDKEPDDPITSALLEAIKPSLDKVDGRQNNGGNHNPNGVNQHTKVAQSGQIRLKLVNSGQFFSETETEEETEVKEKELSDDNSKKITEETIFEAGGQLWTMPLQFRKLAKKYWTESEIREIEIEHSCHEGNVKLSINDLLLSNPPKPKTTRFVKPTVEQIAAYCKERNNRIDPEEFFNHYEGNGWKVGSNSMKDWKAVIRTWEKRDFNRPQQPQKKNWSNYVGEGSFLKDPKDDPFYAEIFNKKD